MVCYSCHFKQCFILFCILTLVKLSLEETCAPGLHMLGYTYPPGDIVLEYGKQNLSIICVLNNENYTKIYPKPSSQMYFLISNTRIKENVEILNDTSILLNMQNLNKSSLMVECRANDEAVCMNKVIVGTKPSKPIDFHCIGENFDNLTCRWIEPDNMVKTEYILKYSFPGRAGRVIYSNCPNTTKWIEGDKVMKKCFWSVASYPHYRQVMRTYIITISGSNVFGNETFEYIFEHYKFVKPGPPENLTVINATTNSIFLKWHIPETMVHFPPGLSYRILYQCQYGPKIWKLADIKFVQSKTVVHYNLTGLKHAHELCDIRVALRSNATNEEDMWSGNSSVTYSTLSTVPGAPPKTTMGSFELKPSSVNMTLYDAYIYWQQIPDEIRNGDDMVYKVKILGDSFGVKLVNSTSAYAKFENLKWFQNYTFAIWTENSKGASVEKSFVTIPAQVNLPTGPNDFTKIANEEGGYYELVWSPPVNQSVNQSNIKRNIYINNYTIFWCDHPKDRPYQCTGHLNWTTVPSNTTAHTVQVPESSNNVWQFAISANSQYFSSGMMWAACTVIPGTGIRKLKYVYQTGIYDKSFELAWKLDCSDGLTSIDKFIGYYCPIVSPTLTNCKGPEQNVTFPSDSLKGVVNGLKPYTTYMVKMGVRTKDGTYSIQSDPIFVSTLEAAPSVPLNLTEKETTNSSIRVTWMPPAEENGKIKYYEVYYNEHSKKVDVIENVPECLLDNLESFKTYNIKVAACTTTCSKRSHELKIKTKIGVPGQMSRPTFKNVNNSLNIEWKKPDEPRGEINYFQLTIREKSSEQKQINVSGVTHLIPSCNQDMNSIFVRVRAVNIDDKSNHLVGEWSDELECFCKSSSQIIWYIIPLVICILLVVMAFVIRRTITCCQDMQNVELKLPPGLTPMSDWNTPKIPDEPDPKTPDEPEHNALADQELLLDKGKINNTYKPPNSGYVSYADVVEKNPPYVSVGDKHDLVTDFISAKPKEKMYVQYSDGLKNISESIPWHPPMETVTKPKEKMYVQYSDGMKNISESIPWQPPGESATKAYVYCGEPVPPAKFLPEPVKGYVPHRQFDATKSYKQD